MARCKRLPAIDNVVAAGGLGARVTLPAGTVGFLLRVLEAVDVDLLLAASVNSPGAGPSFRLKTGETWGEDQVDLDRDVYVVVSTPDGNHVQVLRWDA